MRESGILTEDDRVELLDGQIVPLSPIGKFHAACVDRITQLLVLRFKEEKIVRVQNPVVLNDDSEPEPDLSILAPRADFYAEAPPRPENIELIIEVADTSLEKDKQLKIPLYAAAGIKEVWIIDLTRSEVIVYAQPKGAVYQTNQVFARSAVLASPFLGEIPVKDLIG